MIAPADHAQKAVEENMEVFPNVKMLVQLLLLTTIK